MPRALRVVVLFAYGALLFQYLRLRSDRNNDEMEFIYGVLAQEALKKILHDLKQNGKNMTQPNLNFEKLHRFPTDLKYIPKFANIVQENNSIFSNSAQMAFVKYNSAHFNSTWTYKLDSDIHSSYTTIEDMKGNFAGLKTDMEFVDTMQSTLQYVVIRLDNTKQVAAWSTAHWEEKSGKANIDKELTIELAKYKQKIDTYSSCGEVVCLEEHEDSGEDKGLELNEDYYLHFTFESYVSMLLYSLLHTMPVVFGGANYSRFNDYVYKKTPNVTDVCKSCETLNDPTKEYSVVENLRRKWWIPNYGETRRYELTQSKQMAI